MISNLFENKLYQQFMLNDNNKAIVSTLKSKKQREIYKIHKKFEEQINEGLMTNESKNINIESIIENKILNIFKCTNTINDMIKSYRNLELIGDDISISEKMKDQIIFTYDNPDLEEIIEDSPYNTNKEIDKKKMSAYWRAFVMITYESNYNEGYKLFDIRRNYTLEELRNKIDECIQIKYWPLIYKCINLFTEKRINLNFLKNYNRQIVDINLKLKAKPLKYNKRDRKDNKQRGGNKQRYQQQIGQPPRGQPPRGQPPRGQPPRGQPPRGQPPRGQPPRGQPPRGQPQIYQQQRGQQQRYPMQIKEPKGIKEIYKEYTKIFDLYNKDIINEGEDADAVTIEAIETKIKECYRDNYLEIITKEKVFFLNYKDELKELKESFKDIKIKKKEELVEQLVKRGPNMVMSTDEFEEWVDIIDSDNINTKKIYVKDVAKYLGIDIEPIKTNMKALISKVIIRKDVIKKIMNSASSTQIPIPSPNPPPAPTSSTSEIDNIINKLIDELKDINYDHNIFLLCIKYNIINRLKLVENLKRNRGGDYYIKNNKLIDESKLKRLMLMLEVIDIYVKNYKLYLLRIKNNDTNIRNRIFKYIISYYIAIKHVIVENTKELSLLFNKEKFFEEKYNQKAKEILKINNKYNKKKEEKDQSEHEIVNKKINKNLSKATEMIMNEIKKYPKGSAEREKYVNYYKRVIQGFNS
jgi:hypothetical protein